MLAPSTRPSTCPSSCPLPVPCLSPAIGPKAALRAGVGSACTRRARGTRRGGFGPSAGRRQGRCDPLSSSARHAQGLAVVSPSPPECVLSYRALVSAGNEDLSRGATPLTCWPQHLWASRRPLHRGRVLGTRGNTGEGPHTSPAQCLGAESWSPMAACTRGADWTGQASPAPPKRMTCDCPLRDPSDPAI